MATILITGATSGIGLELAKIHAQNGDRLILVARSTDVLATLQADFKTQFGTEVLPLRFDLSDRAAPSALYDAVKSAGWQVDALVNNAGFGDHGYFWDADPQKIHQMMDLNMTSLVQLTRLFLTDMLARKSGKIMNVASTAAFQPGPTMAVYYATKAFVLSFSEALSEELQGSGVTVTTLCPGPTPSGFQDRSGMHKSRILQFVPLTSSARVARECYHAMMRGKTVAIVGWINAAVVFSTRFAPRAAVRKISSFLTGAH